MRLIPQDRLERTAVIVLGCLTVVALVLAAPAVMSRLQPAAQVQPTPTPTAPPAAVLLREELERDLQGVVILANDETFGTAFAIDDRGNLLTAAHLISGSRGLRVIDNTGGSHQVTVVGVDPRLDLAQVRASTGASPLAFGDSTSLHPGDPGALLASPKTASLEPSTPIVITALQPQLLGIRGDVRLENAGGPIAGYGGKVIAMALSHGPNQAAMALPINAALASIEAWRSAPGNLMPLSPMPLNLTLRGSHEIAGPSRNLSVQSIQPARAAASRETALTLQGTGFAPGPALRLRFNPVSSPTGAFDIPAAFVNATTITAKLPTGHAVQDYMVQLTNGDGATVNGSSAFTITP